MASRMSTFASLSVAERRAGNAEARQIGGVGAPAGTGFFIDHKIFHFNPASFKTLFNVPGGMSNDGWAARVTAPGLDGWCIAGGCLSFWTVASHCFPGR